MNKFNYENNAEAKTFDYLKVSQTSSYKNS